LVNAEERRDFLAGLFADLGFLLPGVAEVAFLPGGGNDVADTGVKEQGAQEQRNVLNITLNSRKPTPAASVSFYKGIELAISPGSADTTPLAWERLRSGGST
jgi:hypothetical protein